MSEYVCNYCRDEGQVPPFRVPAGDHIGVALMREHLREHDRGVPPRVLAAEARREQLAKGSLGCRCGHMLSDHDADDWTRQGDPVNRQCRIEGCDCGHDGRRAA